MADILDPKEQAENELIEQEYQFLIKDYLASNHRKKVARIEKAFLLAKTAHKGIKRKSGEPYILHPLAVARIVAKEIGLGSTSICAALLHDVVEDTDYTVEDIANLFDPKIAQIVDGLTKISGGVFGENVSGQAENFRKLLLTISEDIRVILIKIADRLHNMRTLGSMPAAKQYKIAGETEYIYAPLAHRLGLFAIKVELEDLSFKYNFPSVYEEISQKINENHFERMLLYDKFSLPIVNKLNSLGYKYSIRARIKSVYSVWNKMKKKNLPFEEIYDILAVRIVFEPNQNVDEKEQCWIIYNNITNLYIPHPERLRNWLNTPKANGYEALHVTVMGPEGQWIEVQIRSMRMDDIAEKGLAAHWKYKQQFYGDSELDKWLNTINDILKNPNPNAMDFLDTFKLTLYATEIFVFTPKGEIKTLPSGATALDFAFEIHSDIGMRCIGAKVNNRLVPLSYELQSGDQIEILTSKQQTPQTEWLSYVTTARAKQKLNLLFKNEQKTIKAQGESMLRKALTEAGLIIKKDISNDVIKRMLQHFDIQNYEELTLKIGKGDISLANIQDITKLDNKKTTVRSWYPRFFFGKDADKDASSTTQEENKKNGTYQLTDEMLQKEHTIAPCCKPIPGDQIIGFLNDKKEIIVHKRDCKEALKLKSQKGSSIITAEWANTQKKYYATTIEVQGVDRKRILLDILLEISAKLDANIEKLCVETNDGIFTAKMNVYVSHVDTIQQIYKQLKGLEGIQRVARIEE
jgi:GTP diphosphokinase / guanosine-3',5'-bis(diphosphate) 3'-diphosphatase